MNKTTRATFNEYADYMEVFLYAELLRVDGICFLADNNHAVEALPKTNQLRIVCMSAPVCVFGSIGYVLLRLSRYIQKRGRERVDLDPRSKVKHVRVRVKKICQACGVRI